jgi:acetyltransferase-like isoleucine patch superfamily enzyme
VVVSGGVEIGDSSFLGVNVTLRDHITIGKNCVVGAGVLLLENAEPNGLYKGATTSRSDFPALDLRKI